jgi:hypothetical protein
MNEPIIAMRLSSNFIGTIIITDNKPNIRPEIIPKNMLFIGKKILSLTNSSIDMILLKELKTLDLGRLYYGI